MSECTGVSVRALQSPISSPSAAGWSFGSGGHGASSREGQLRSLPPAQRTSTSSRYGAFSRELSSTASSEASRRMREVSLPTGSHRPCPAGRPSIPALHLARIERNVPCGWETRRREI